MASKLYFFFNGKHTVSVHVLFHFYAVCIINANKDVFLFIINRIIDNLIVNRNYLWGSESSGKMLGS